jgi:predicted MFS family arabinose efflux permease
VSLLLLPFLLNAISAGSLQPPIILFVVVYGLDWVATVPPTAALCREVFGADGSVVYGWVFASHQIGASLAAIGAGVIRDTFGDYTWAWFGAASLCVVAAVVSAGITRKRRAVLA